MVGIYCFWNLIWNDENVEPENNCTFFLNNRSQESFSAWARTPDSGLPTGLWKRLFSRTSSSISPLINTRVISWTDLSTSLVTISYTSLNRQAWKPVPSQSSDCYRSYGMPWQSRASAWPAFGLVESTVISNGSNIFMASILWKRNVEKIE